MNKKQKRYISVIIVLIVFILIAVALLGQYGWMVTRTGGGESGLSILEDNSFTKLGYSGEETQEENPDCLYLWDSTDENSAVFYDQMTQILHDMKVEYTETDLSKEEMPDPDQYQIVITGFTNFQEHSSVILEVVSWMEKGGNLLMPQVPETGSVYSFMSPRIGVENLGSAYYEVSGIRITDDFMITGEQTEYAIEYPYQSALTVSLGESCEVHMVSADGREVPLLWETDRREGHVVVVNLGHYEKNCRGIYAAAYSLLSEYCVWPVINSSAFYIDGFPFPLPKEKNSYITKEYGDNMDMYSFYVREWWNDLISLAEEYGISYTGTIQENNDNDVEAPFESKASSNRYQYFASTLMELDGELGLFGYNQQPLCLETSDIGTREETEEDIGEETEELDYEKDLGLKYWNNKSDMAAGLKEVEEFQKGIIDSETMQVYTPPSNIWSEDGLDAIKDTLPDIAAVAADYFSGGYAKEQEYEVDEDGMIMTPRITSGGEISEDMKLSAFSELNFHYVVSHSISPTDVLNPDAGADLGWPAMVENLNDYEKWQEEAAPDIRRMTGSEMAGAVQRFYYLGSEEIETKDGLEIQLSNFQDEAWLMIRFNEWTPDEESVKGGSLTKLSGNLYLLEAEQDTVTIQRKDAK